MEETNLVMARRHVQEGKNRIFRQEVLLERLCSSGDPSVARKAVVFLVQMLALQGAFEAHLAQIERDGY